MPLSLGNSKFAGIRFAHSGICWTDLNRNLCRIWTVRLMGSWHHFATIVWSWSLHGCVVTWWNSHWTVKQIRRDLKAKPLVFLGTYFAVAFGRILKGAQPRFVPYCFHSRITFERACRFIDLRLWNSNTLKDWKVDIISSSIDSCSPASPSACPEETTSVLPAWITSAYVPHVRIPNSLPPLGDCSWVSREGKTSWSLLQVL